MKKVLITGYGVWPRSGDAGTRPPSLQKSFEMKPETPVAE